MGYELWETAAGNIVGNYATKAAALEVVRDSAMAYGHGYIDSWALVYEDDDENVRPLAAGADLLKLAKRPISA